MKMGLGVLVGLGVVFTACGEGSSEMSVIASEDSDEMPSLTFRATESGVMEVTESPGMRPGVYPFRFIVLDTDGGVLKEEVRHGPRKVEPPPPEVVREWREFLDTAEGREVLDWLGLNAEDVANG